MTFGDHLWSAIAPWWAAPVAAIVAAISGVLAAQWFANRYRNHDIVRDAVVRFAARASELGALSMQREALIAGISKNVGELVVAKEEGNEAASARADEQVQLFRVAAERNAAHLYEAFGSLRTEYVTLGILMPPEPLLAAETVLALVIEDSKQPLEGSIDAESMNAAVTAFMLASRKPLGVKPLKMPKAKRT
jgi:hypothetical protein